MIEWPPETFPLSTTILKTKPLIWTFQRLFLMKTGTTGGMQCMVYIICWDKTSKINSSKDRDWGHFDSWLQNLRSSWWAEIGHFRSLWARNQRKRNAGFQLGFSPFSPSFILLKFSIHGMVPCTLRVNIPSWVNSLCKALKGTHRSVPQFPR